jgi:riboflavin kinase/FMN adenylyltransferase
MRIFRDIGDSSIQTPSVLTFGVFDGLHLGHQLIMTTLAETARRDGLPATVVTFDPHPRAVLQPDSAPPLLQTFDQKVRGLERLGIDQVIVLKFTPEFSHLSAEGFLRDVIFGRLDARAAYLGRGSAFGRNREGGFSLLADLASKLGRGAAEVPEVSVHRRRVSSTVIRSLLGAGLVNQARRMLGRPYGIQGQVIEGRKLGKSQLNYATANLRPRNCVLPAEGVYITLTRIEDYWRRSVTNVGRRPTFGGDSEPTIETHVVEFDADLYGKTICVRFLHRLRGEIKFGSGAELRAQIGRDYDRAVKYLARNSVRRNLEFP